MKQEVWITVRGEQYFDGVDPNETELTTLGTLEDTEEGWLLSYEESELTGMAGTVTSFAIAPERVVLRRSGSVNSEMIFEEGLPHTSLYEMAMGTLTVDVHTESLRARISGHGGLLEIRYQIAVNHHVTGKNCFKVRVKAKA